ncbi:polyprenol phosphomannose-dependent alpha 1,6 mannosyltransferase MptB [Actinophytocola sp.]|uniref:polyprenol phosphomannose-dependent alpha 1,6 mannosyltransferase MptB n=1 Tax=Actinophytocola sp. TaxID=1872138 RepID=UPI00389A2FB1
MTTTTDAHGVPPAVSTIENTTPAPATDRRAPAFPVRTITLGTIGSLLILVSALGAGAILAQDPLIGRGPFSWIRYGHGRILATLVLYVGFALVVWAWVLLGRHVLARRVGTRPVLIASLCWTIPMLFSPPVFSRDAYLYIAYGTLPLHGYDPYSVGPGILDVPPVVDNVDSFWQATPAPYGPLFILLAKGVISITGTNMIAGVILMKFGLVIGVALMVWAMPGLVRHLGGRLPVALWLAVAGPMTVVHLVGGPHNDVLMVGLLAVGTVMVLDRKHVLGMVVVTLAVAVKVTAAVALPFLVWVWAGHLESTRWRNFARACAASVGIFVVTFAAATAVSGVNLGWISALDAPTAIVNWLSVPTGAGEILHGLVGIFADLPKVWFVTLMRIVGVVFMIWVLVRQWWLARDGGADAVRRAAIALFAFAVLSPATLPWYLAWGAVIAAALRWERRQLAVLVTFAVFLVLTYTPAGDDLLYNWLFMALAAGVSVVAGQSLLRRDPLNLFPAREPLLPGGPSVDR